MIEIRPPLTPEQEARMAETRRNLAEIAAKAAQNDTQRVAEDADAGMVPKASVERQNSICKTCGAKFLANIGVMGAMRIVQMHCEACCEAYRREQNPEPEDLRQRREQSWLALCPAEYRDTDETRVRFEIGDEVVNKALAWTHDRGLRLVGQTGKCKTRLMFLVLKKFHMAGKTIRVMNGATMADQLADAYTGRGQHEAESFMRGIEKAPLLFIDDLGKGKFTERVDVFLYRLSEYRSSNRLPLFYTSNLTTTHLQSEWDRLAHAGGFWADRAGPTIRRIKLCCQGIPL